MKKNTTYVLFILICVNFLMLTSCDIKKNKDVEPKDEFLKIYDNQTFSDSYLPLDIKQTADEGFLLLAKTRISSSPFYGIYLLKTDKEGNFVAEQKIPETYVSPTSSLMKVGQNYYFFCMNSLTLETVLIRVDDSGVFNVVSQFTNLLYPISCALEESSGSFILQNYNRDDRRTIVAKISSSGQMLDSTDFNIGIGDFDVEEPIIDHLTGNGKHLPFLTGSLGNGTYFFNGFYNYTLSTVFFSFGGTGAPGVLQGYKDERCISSALYLSDIGKFALSGYAYGNNTIYPSATVNYNAGAIASSSDLTGFPIPEFNTDARVVLKRETLNNKDVLIYGSDTKSGQIALYFYDASTGNFIASKHLGYANTFVMGNLIKTTDEGLAVVGTTYLSGRFPRLCLFKLSKKDMENTLP